MDKNNLLALTTCIFLPWNLDFPHSFFSVLEKKKGVKALVPECGWICLPLVWNNTYNWKIRSEKKVPLNFYTGHNIHQSLPEQSYLPL